jgi:hypothetical protein
MLAQQYVKCPQVEAAVLAGDHAVATGGVPASGGPGGFEEPQHCRFDLGPG